MIGLSEIYGQEEPAIVCSQSMGTIMEPANFWVAEAKVKATAITGKPSGEDTREGLVSQIPGALPIKTGHGKRVMAAGGLTAQEDVAAVQEAML